MSREPRPLRAAAAASLTVCLALFAAAPVPAQTTPLEAGDVLVSDIDSGALLRLRLGEDGTATQEVLACEVFFLGMAVDLERTVVGAIGVGIPSVTRVDPLLAPETGLPVLHLGAPFVFPIDVEIDARGRFLVLDDGLLGDPQRPGPPGFVFHLEGEVDADGFPRFPPQTLVSGGDLIDVQQFAIHPDGQLYVQTLNAFKGFAGGILRIDPEDPAAGQQRITAPTTRFISPTGVAVMPDGRLALATFTKREAVGALEACASPPCAEEVISRGQQLVEPVQLALDASGRILVADAGAGGVIRIDPTLPVDANQTLFAIDSVTETCEIPIPLEVRPGGIAVVPPAPVLRVGDILVGDRGSEAIVRIDPTTGDQTLLRLTPLGFGGLAVEAGPRVLATRTRQLVRVDPTRSTQPLVTPQGCGKTDCVDAPIDVALDATGSILLLDAGPEGEEAATPPGAVRAVHASGARLKVATVAQGDLLRAPRQLAAHPDGRLFVAAAAALGDAMGAVVRIEADGSQSSLRAVAAPSGIAVERSGQLVVADEAGARLERIDPDSGAAQTVLAGGALRAPRQLAIADDDRILVVDGGDADAGVPPRLLRVDPQSGATEVLSAGDHLLDPVGIAVVPEPAATLLAAVALAALGLLARRRAR